MAESATAIGGSSMSMDIKPHAYDPASNPELFEGVLARRVVAFLIDFIVIAIPVVLAAMFIFVFGIVTFGVGWALYLAAAAGLGDLGHRLFRHHPRRPALGHHRHADDGSGNAHLVRRAGLFRARRRACHRLLAVGVGLHAVRPAGRLFNQRRRLLHDIVLGTVIINNPQRAAQLRPFGAGVSR